MLRSRLFSVAAALLASVVFVSGAFAQADPFVVPTELEAGAIQTATLAVVGPAIGIILGMGATFAVAWAVYRIIVRKTVKFSRG